MGIEIIAIILFILFTIEIVYIFMYSGNTNEVQQNITSGGINLPPLPPPPSSNIGIGHIRTNRPYIFDSDFDNGRIIRSGIDYIDRGRRGRGRGRGRESKHQHLTNIDFLVGNKKNTAIPVQSVPRFDFEEDDNDYKIDLKREDPNKKLFIKFHIHKHNNNIHSNRNHNNRHSNNRHNRHHNRHHNRDDDDDSFNIRYRIKNEKDKNILEELGKSGEFKFHNNNQILTIGKIKDISEFADKIKIKIDLE